MSYLLGREAVKVWGKLEFLCVNLYAFSDIDAKQSPLAYIRLTYLQVYALSGDTLRRKYFILAYIDQESPAFYSLPLIGAERCKVHQQEHRLMFCSRLVGKRSIYNFEFRTCRKQRIVKVCSKVYIYGSRDRIVLL